MIAVVLRKVWQPSFDIIKYSVGKNLKRYDPKFLIGDAPDNNGAT